MEAKEIVGVLAKLGNQEKAAHLSQFFKTGRGEYGEGDLFLGVTVPEQRAVAKQYEQADWETLEALVASPWHEVRLTGLLIVVRRFGRSAKDEEEQKRCVSFYLEHTKQINNWDLVDLTCRDILGEYLVNRDRSILYRLAGSDCLWERRIAIVSTWAFIHRDDFTDTLALAEQLLGDPHDLMRKAVGWMLREVGKRDRATLTAFLEKHAADMPQRLNGSSIDFILSSSHSVVRVKYIEHPAQNSPRST